MSASITNLARLLGQQLLARNLVIGTAESCTGGMIAAAITDVAGSSGWFDEGLVTYSNKSKQSLLSVGCEVLEQNGAVSQAVVAAMVTGVLARGSSVALATSGIAGPGGGSVEKPVGTVWFAWGDCSVIETECKQFSGDRIQVREQATEHALKQLNSFIETTV